MAPETRRPLEISACRGCHNSVIDPAALVRALEEAVLQHDLDGRLIQLHNGKLPHHLILKAAVAGCPNSCSQPQIKDYGLIGRSEPLEGEEECINCGLCVEACPDFAITISDSSDRPGSGAGPRPVIDPELCQRCAKCARACPTGSLIAGPAGVEVLAGGRVGRHPKFALTLKPWAGTGEAVKTFVDQVERYLAGARPGERFANWFERCYKSPADPVTGVTSANQAAG